MIDVLTVKALVSRQLAIIENPERREALRLLLTEPVLEYRAWQYGPTPQRFPCWVVGRAPADGLAFVYCEYGFGPAFPWGCVEDASGDLGMDAQWNWYLEEAFVQSGLWAGPVLASEPYHSPPEKRFPHPYAGASPHARRPTGSPAVTVDVLERLSSTIAPQPNPGVQWTRCARH